MLILIFLTNYFFLIMNIYKRKTFKFNLNYSIEIQIFDYKCMFKELETHFN